MNRELQRIAVPGVEHPVHALLMGDPAAERLLVLGHGAGAGMEHPFMAAVASDLAKRGIATLRYNFPYMQSGGRRPDRPATLTATVRAAVALGVELAAGKQVFAGGKSLGGRMTSTAQSQEIMPGVAGLVFLGFPLHTPGKPATVRAGHLAEVHVPLLFLQGNRDRLADLALMREVADELGSNAVLHVVEDGDHSFKVRKRSGRDETQVIEELAERIDSWTAATIASASSAT